MAYRQWGFQTYDWIQGILVRLSEHESPHKVKLGDDYQYPIKGSGESSYKLDSGKEVLFVPGLKKNLLSISALDAKGMRVALIDGQVIMWPKGKTIDDAVVIGEQEGGLYKLKGHPEKALVHDTVEPSELWHRWLAHMHYITLPIVSKAIEGLPEIQAKHDGVCKGCARERTQRKHFHAVKEKKKEYWKSSTPMYVDQCHQAH